eukprot:212924_1
MCLALTTLFGMIHIHWYLPLLSLSIAQVLNWMLCCIPFVISYHKLTYLRRAMMIIESLSRSPETRFPKPNPNTYYNTLYLLVFILNEIHSEQGRHLFPFYGIHIPRSSGTTLCAAFKRIAKQQSPTHASRYGSFNVIMEGSKNCNYNG